MYLHLQMTTYFLYVLFLLFFNGIIFNPKVTIKSRFFHPVGRCGITKCTLEFGTFHWIGLLPLVSSRVLALMYEAE